MFALREVRCRKEVLLASYPVLFAVQQFAEGLVWLSLDDASRPGLTSAAAGVYLFFSHVFWPVMFPLTVLALEGDARRRRLVARLFLPLGIALSGYLFACIHLGGGVSAVLAVCGHVDYQLLIPGVTAAKVVYGVVVLGSFGVASDRRLALFGALIGLALALSFLIAEAAIISVWCFFAALLSLYLLWYLRGGSATASRG